MIMTTATIIENRTQPSVKAEGCRLLNDGIDRQHGPLSLSHRTAQVLRLNNALDQVCRPIELIERTTPKRLFKHLRRAHAEELVNEGWIRIGVLSEYRNEERLGSVIGDKGEGQLTERCLTQGFRSEDRPPEFDFINRALFAGKCPAHVRIRGLAIEQTCHVQNCHILCLTSCHDRSKYPQYERTVRIGDVVGFLKAVMDAVHGSRPLLEGMTTLSACKYVGRTVSAVRGPDWHPVFTKPSNYSWQQEWRLWWHRPIAESDSAMTVQIRDPGRFCSLL